MKPTHGRFEVEFFYHHYWEDSKLFDYKIVRFLMETLSSPLIKSKWCQVLGPLENMMSGLFDSYIHPEKISRVGPKSLGY